MSFPVEIDVCQPDGAGTGGEDCARFMVKADRTWKLLGTYDAEGNRYPDLFHTQTASMYDDEALTMYLSLRHANIPVSISTSGTIDLYLICTYVGGVLQSCVIKQV